MDKYLFFNREDSSSYITSMTQCGVFPLSRLKGVFPTGNVSLRFAFEPAQTQYNDGGSEDVTIGDTDTVTLTVTGDLLYKVLTGSIDVTGTNTDVPGTSTLYLTELAVGDKITVTGETREIATITDNTTATVTAAWGSDLANDTSPIAWRPGVANEHMTNLCREIFKKIQAAPPGSLITIFDARNSAESISNISTVTISRKGTND